MPQCSRCNEMCYRAYEGKCSICYHIKVYETVEDEVVIKKCGNCGDKILSTISTVPICARCNFQDKFVLKNCCGCGCAVGARMSVIPIRDSCLLKKKQQNEQNKKNWKPNKSPKQRDRKKRVCNLVGNFFPLRLYYIMI